MEYNLLLEYLCGDMFPFTKTLPARDKKSESFISIYHKPPLVLREDKDVENMPNDKPLEEMGRVMNPKSMGSSIHPR